MNPASSRPVLHYFDIGSLGRGEVVRLFLKDADIDFQDTRYNNDDTWEAAAGSIQSKGLSRTGLLPVLEYQNANLTQHIPILRYLSRELGKYDGSTSFEKYMVDAVSDVYIDWRFQWVANRGKASNEYKNEYAPSYYRVLGQYYSERVGPYLLGERISYTDFAVYQSIHDDEKTGTLPATLPDVLTRFRLKFEARPNIQRYLASGRST